jgi:hypothetical protein
VSTEKFFFGAWLVKELYLKVRLGQTLEQAAHLVAAYLAETIKGVSLSAGFKSSEWTSILVSFNSAAGVIFFNK